MILWCVGFFSGIGFVAFLVWIINWLFFDDDLQDPRWKR